MSFITPIGVTLGLLLSASAFGYTRDSFYGWAPDGSFYTHANAGTDMVDRPEVCLSDAKVVSKNWPNGVELPKDGSCTSLCDSESMQCAEPQRARKWVRLPAPSKTGPHGEIIQAKVEKGHAIVQVIAGGQKLAEAVLELDSAGERPSVREVYWRPDDGAVAVHLGTSDGKGGDGYPPPRYLAVLQLKAAGAATTANGGDRLSAEAANVRGMKLYRAKDYAKAQQEFKGALSADASYAVAHYNLACVAALLGDKKTAIAELKWLGASSDSVAKAKLAKSKSDPDLKSVTGDPSVQSLYGASSAGGSCDCDSARDACEKVCTEKYEGNYVRGCVRACTSKYDACSAKCGDK